MIKRNLTIALFLSCTGLYAQEVPTSFSLQEAQDYAVKNSYNIRLAETDVKMAVKQMNEVAAIGLPQVNGEVKFQNFIDIPTTLIPTSSINPMAPEGEFLEAKFGTNYNTSAGITGTQLIFDGAYIVGLKATKAFVGASQKGVEKSGIEVKNSVAEAYFGVLVAEESVKVLELSLTNLKKTLSETQQLYNVGFAAEQDVDQMALTLSTIENAVNRSVRQVELSYQLLKLHMGMPLEGEIMLKDKLEDIVGTLNYESLTTSNFNVEKHIDYQMLQSQQNLVKLNWRKEQVSVLPQFSAFISHQQSSMGDEFKFNKWYPATLWGLNLNVPIFGSGLRMYKTQRVRLDYEKTVIQLSQAEQSLKLQANSSLLEFRTAYESYINERKNMELAEKIQNKTTVRYKEGVASSIELTQVQNQFLGTQGNYINAIFQLLNAKTKLDKAFNNY